MGRDIEKIIPNGKSKFEKMAMAVSELAEKLRKVRQYNKHRLDGEPKMSVREYKDLVGHVKISSKMKVDEITKARLMAIIDEDREDCDFPTCREQQCPSCWHRIYYTSNSSHVDLCTLGLDMDRLTTCTEWANQREFSMKMEED